MKTRRRVIAFAITVVGALVGWGLQSPSVAQADEAASPRPLEYCQVFDALLPFAGGAAAGVALPDGTLVDAELVHVEGADCQAADARVALDGAVFHRPGVEVHGRSAAGLASRAQAGGTPAVGEGTLVVDNVSIGTFNTELRLGFDPAIGIFLYWHVNGTVRLTLNGVATTLRFVGDLRDLDNYTLNITTPPGGVTIPGFAPDPFSFTGTVTNTAGKVSVDLSANAGRLLFQGLTLSNASLRLRAGDGQSTRLDVRGTAAIGPSTVGLDLALVLAADGSIVSGSGGATLDLQGTLPDGAAARITGQATVSVVGTTATLTLDAAGAIGALTLNPSTLSVELVGRRATITGQFALEFPGGTADLDGRLVYDGDNARLEALQGTASARYAGTLSDGTPVAVTGTAQVGADAQGAVSTVFDGAGNLGPWAATGVHLDITGSPDAATMSGRMALDLNGSPVEVSGSATIAGSSVTALDLSGALGGPLPVGSAIVTGGTLSLKRTASGSIAVTLDGSVRLAGGGVVTGTFDVTIDASGRLVALTGSGSGQDIVVSSSLRLVDVRFSLGAGGVQLSATAQLSCRNTGGVLESSVSATITDTANWTAALTGAVPAAGCELTQGLALGAGTTFSGSISTVAGATSARVSLAATLTGSFLPLGGTTGWNVAADLVADAGGLRADLALTAPAISGSLSGAVAADGTFSLNGSAKVSVLGSQLTASGSLVRATPGGAVSGSLKANVASPLSLGNGLSLDRLDVELGTTGVRIAGQARIACVGGGSLTAGFDTTVTDTANWQVGFTAATTSCSIARDIALGTTSLTGQLRSVNGAGSASLVGTASASGAGLPFGTWQVTLDVQAGAGGATVAVSGRASDGLTFSGAVQPSGTFSFAVSGSRIAIGATGSASFAGTFSSTNGGPVAFAINGSLAGPINLNASTVLTAASFRLTNTGTSGVSGTVRLSCPKTGTLTATGTLTYTSATNWSVGVNVAARNCQLQGKVWLNNNEVVNGTVKMVNGVSSFDVTTRIAAVNLFDDPGYWGAKLDVTNIDVRLASTPSGGLDLTLNSATMNYGFNILFARINVGVTFSLRVTDGRLVSLGLTNFRFGFGIYSQSWVKSDIDRFTRQGLAL